MTKRCTRLRATECRHAPQLTHLSGPALSKLAGPPARSTRNLTRLKKRGRARKAINQRGSHGNHGQHDRHFPAPSKFAGLSFGRRFGIRAYFAISKSKIRADANPPNAPPALVTE
jgi:hypothetical protein